MNVPNRQPHSSHILQTAMGFWASKVLLTAVELDLFTTLGKGSMTAQQLGDALGLHTRETSDFFDALVALKFLDREGNGPQGKYRNTPDTSTFLDKASPSYIGEFARMLDSYLYGFWEDLDTALKTGKPQNEDKHGDTFKFEQFDTNEDRLRNFLESIGGAQAVTFEQLAHKFDFFRYNMVSDIVDTVATLSRIVARKHKLLVFNSFDLPPVAPLAQRHIDAARLSDRINVISGEFFKDDLPKADVITMGNIIHNWDLKKKKILIKKAHNALPRGGVLIFIENIIDDERRENVFGLLISLNMLIELGDALDYTSTDFRVWYSETGFSNLEFIHLTGP